MPATANIPGAFALHFLATSFDIV